MIEKGFFGRYKETGIRKSLTRGLARSLTVMAVSGALETGAADLAKQHFDNRLVTLVDGYGREFKEQRPGYPAEGEALIIGGLVGALALTGSTRIAYDRASRLDKVNRKSGKREGR